MTKNTSSSCKIEGNTLKFNGFLKVVNTMTLNNMFMKHEADTYYKGESVFIGGNKGKPSCFHEMYLRLGKF